MSTSRRRMKEEALISTNNEAIGVSKTIRGVQPQHYLLKIESFSVLSKSKIEKYESDDFEAGGYKWRLCLYPNGNKKRNESDHISLYLAISDTNSLPQGWEVNVQFKLFVYDHVRDEYLTLEVGDGRICRFHGMKTEWRFDQFLSLDSFNNTSNGYLLDDTCAFGAEVLVTKYASKVQCFSLVNLSQNNTYTWKVEHFSEIKKKKLLYSDKFKVGEGEWKLILYPKGNEEGKGKSLSLYLAVADHETLSPKWRVYAEYKIRLRDQVRTTHIEKITNCWFNDEIIRDWGISSFILLCELNDTSKDYMVNDTLIVEAEITMISMTKNIT